MTTQERSPDAHPENSLQAGGDKLRDRVAS